jgi:hypothetical protein
VKFNKPRVREVSVISKKLSEGSTLADLNFNVVNVAVKARYYTASEEIAKLWVIEGRVK